MFASNTKNDDALISFQKANEPVSVLLRGMGKSMSVLRNLTLHHQGAREQALAAEAGFELEVEPFGVEVSSVLGGFNTAAMRLAERLILCANRGDGALIGGHTALWIAALDILSRRDVPRPDLYYFETVRRRDASDRFVFVPERLEGVNGANSVSDRIQQDP